LIDGVLPIIGTMLIDSQPAAIITSASPTRIRSAAIASAVRPDAQKRLTVTPPTVFGSPPATHGDARDVQSLLGLGYRAADDRVLDRGRIEPGTCASALRIACTSRSSGRTLRNMPLGALPIGVRVAATM
jgi:hypothetical protein